MDLQEIITLSGWGLTINQAKTYLGLLELGTAKAQQISEKVSVAQGDIYRITSSLEDLGLVERIIDAPIRFKAIKMEHAIEILSKKKKEELVHLEKATKSLFLKSKSYPQFDLNSKSKDFVLLPNSSQLRARRSAIETTRKSVDVISSLKVSQSPFNIYLEDVMAKVESGIKFRVLINKSEMEFSREIFDLFAKYPNFQIRYLENGTSILMTIHDQEIAFFPTVHPNLTSKGVGFCTGNPYLLRILTEFFEYKWSEAKTISSK